MQRGLDVLEARGLNPSEEWVGLAHQRLIDQVQVKGRPDDRKHLALV